MGKNPRDYNRLGRLSPQEREIQSNREALTEAMGIINQAIENVDHDKTCDLYPIGKKLSYAENYSNKECSCWIGLWFSKAQAYLKKHKEK